MGKNNSGITSRLPVKKQNTNVRKPTKPTKPTDPTILDAAIKKVIKGK